MSIPTYLVRRGKRGTYHARMSVPAKWRLALGKSEYTKSLRTSDLQEAIRRARPYLGIWQAEIDGVRVLMGSLSLTEPNWAAAVAAHSPPLEAPSKEELEEAAVTVGYDFELSMMDDGRRNLRHASADFWARNVRLYQQLTQDRARHAATGNFSEIEDMADDAIDTLGWNLRKGTDLYEQFCSLIAQANLAALIVSNQRNEGQVEADTDNKLVQRVRQRKTAIAPAGEKLIDLFDRYAGQRVGEKRKRADTIKQDRKVILSFAGFVGDSQAVSLITGDDVRDWIEILEVLPPNFGKMNAYKGLTLREAAKQAKAGCERGPALTTLNKYLSTVSPLFRWLIKRNYHPGPNPCDGLFYDVVKGSNPRPPFTTDQLNAILNSPLFAGFEKDGKEHRPGEMQADDWRKWVPIVCLFTGARVGEIAQLRVEDIRQERGVWFIHIRHDLTTGQTTKSGFSRAAPVHSRLIQVGFLSFRERRAVLSQQDGNPQLFPELEKGARGHISEKVSRWWREYLSSIGIKNGADGFGSHSFRHTLADRMRVEAELLDDQIEVALGHNQKTTTAGYGRIPQGTVTLLQRFYEAVCFEGLDFDQLMSCPSLDTTTGQCD